MARTKKTDPLVGMSRDPEGKLTVQKSHPLTALWQSDLTLAEFKILDAYLARINSKKPEQRTIKLTKGELEEALGVTRINKDDLKQRLKNLYSPIDLEPGNPKKIQFRSLFEEAEAEQDDDGVWQVQLTCTPSAMKYMFNVERLGYLRYKLRCITSLTSRYTYILFIYLESNRFRESWEIELKELKQILNCHKDDLYKEYKRFNERILKRCQKELAEKTECRFTYEPIRKGRSVAAIRFTLELLSPRIEAEIQGQDPNQRTIFDMPDDEENQYDDEARRLGEQERRNEEIGAGFGADLLREFSDEELIALKNLAFPLASHEDIVRHAGIMERTDAVDFATADYLVRKVALMNVYDKRKPIGNRFVYLKTAIEKELKKQ